MPERPGGWARAAAVATAAGSLGVVLAAAGGLDLAHRVLAACSVAPAVAVVVLAWWWYPTLRVPRDGAALGLLLAAAATGALEAATGQHGAGGLHLALAAAALASAGWTAVRAGPPNMPEGSLRDHVTLTKPRIMTLLLLTGACAMVAGGHRLPAPWALPADNAGLGLGCGGVGRAQPRAGRRHRPAMRRTARGRWRRTAYHAAHAAEFGVALRQRRSCCLPRPSTSPRRRCACSAASSTCSCTRWC